MQYLTIQETADALSVSPDTIRRMLAKLGAVDLNRGRGKNRIIRIPVEALEAFLGERRILPPAGTKQPPKADWHLPRRR